MNKVHLRTEEVQFFRAAAEIICSGVFWMGHPSAVVTNSNNEHHQEEQQQNRLCNDQISPIGGLESREQTSVLIRAEWHGS